MELYRCIDDATFLKSAVAVRYSLLRKLAKTPALARSGMRRVHTTHRSRFARMDRLWEGGLVFRLVPGHAVGIRLLAKSLAQPEISA